MSRAPIIKGTRKFANPNKMGTATKKIMVVPCMVIRRLKTCGETKSL